MYLVLNSSLVRLCLFCIRKKYMNKGTHSINANKAMVIELFTIESLSVKSRDYRSISAVIEITR
jgi:ribosomal protein S17E